jgi:hypothetical protein
VNMEFYGGTSTWLAGFFKIVTFAFEQLTRTGFRRF